MIERTGTIPARLVEDARRVPIEEVWQRLGFDPVRSGAAVRSPFREDEHPSLQVGGTKNVAFDHATGETLDTIGLARRVKNCGFADAVRFILGDVATEAGEPTKRDSGDPVERLATLRGWTLDGMRALGCHADGAAVTFPMKDAQGQVTGEKLRRGDGKPFDNGSKSLTRRGEHNGLFVPAGFSAMTGPVLVVEGEADTLAALSAGHAATVGTAGAVPGRRAIRWLQVLLSGREVVLAPDPDDAGRKWLETVGNALVNSRSIVKFIPAGDGDLDARLRRESDKAAALREMIGAAVEFKPSAGTEPSASDSDDSTEPKRQRPLTDLGNAERFRDQHRGRVLFDVRVQRWRVFDGVRWTLDATGEIARMAHRTARTIYREAAQAKNPEHAQALGKWAARSESKERLAAMVDIAKTLDGLVLAPEKWDSQPWALNVENGTIDLKTGTLKPHNPSDYLTKLAPVSYTPGATHPTLERVLCDALPDADLRRYVAKVFGYALCGQKDERIIPFPYGPKASGKSTVLDSFLAMIGGYGATVEPGVFMSQMSNASRTSASPELARLQGIRFVLTSETNEGQRLDANLLKRISGGDRLCARHLYGSPFEFRPEFVVCFVSNHRPQAPDGDEALWDRMRVLPFDHSIPEDQRDPNVKHTLESDPAARSALLAWVLEGCLLWQSEGLKAPESVRRATTAYKQAMDALGDFLGERCVLDPAACVQSSSLRAAYETWAKNAGVRRPISGKSFAQRLRDRGLDSVHREHGRIWLGIRLLNDGDPDGTDTTDGSLTNFSTRERIGESYTDSRQFRQSRQPDPETYSQTSPEVPSCPTDQEPEPEFLEGIESPEFAFFENSDLAEGCGK